MKITHLPTILLILLLSTNITIAQIPSYYNGIDFTETGTTLESSLRVLSESKIAPLTYANAYEVVKVADEDASNTSNVILMYSSVSENKNNTYGSTNNPVTFPEVWNREHVYPQSLISTQAASDVHNLRACDADVNNNRANLPFVIGTGTFGTATGGWEPGTDWRGDVARIIMYMKMHYNEPFADIGTMSIFLQWNIDDPVSDLETQRNVKIKQNQGNRNPFIDNPYLATIIWGGAAAEDKWNLVSVEENLLSKVKFYPNPVSEMLQIDMGEAKIESFEVLSLSGQSLLKFEQIYNNLIDVNSLSEGVYFLRLNSKNGVVNRKFVKE